MNFLEAVERMKEGASVILDKEKREYISSVNLYQMCAKDIVSFAPSYTIYRLPIEMQHNGVICKRDPLALKSQDTMDLVYEEFVPAESIGYYTEELTNRHKIAMYTLYMLQYCYDLDMDAVSIKRIRNFIDMNNNNK